MRGQILIYSASLSEWQTIEQFLVSQPEIDYWFSPFEGCVFLTSPLTVRQLRQSIDQFFGPASRFFFLIEPDPQNLDGRLPKEAWDVLLDPVHARELRDEPYAAPLGSEWQRSRLLHEAKGLAQPLLSPGSGQSGVEASAETRARVVIAEDLALRYAEESLGTPLRRHVGLFRGEHRFAVDGYARTASGVIVVEVKLVPHERWRTHLDRCVGALLAMNDAIAAWQKETPTFVYFVVVADGLDNASRDEVRATLANAVTRGPIPTRLEVMEFADLKSKFGL